MSMQGYREFLKKMGHRVRYAGGVYWYNASPRVYVSFPFNRLVDPYTLEIRDVLGLDGMVARFPCARELGRLSYRLICDVKDYGLTTLSQKARNQTRRGLERCEVHPIASEELFTQAIRLNKSTLIRQGRKITSGLEHYWMRYYRFALETNGAEMWGAFVENKLVAYLVSFCMDRCANILIVRSDSQYLKLYPNNALLFIYLESTLGKGEIDEVSIGLESLQHGMDSLDRFKLGMGFRKAEVGQRIEVTRWLRPFLIQSVATRIERATRGQAKSSEFFSKFSGMLRWYTEQPRLAK